jgi:hypothetical protein
LRGSGGREEVGLGLCERVLLRCFLVEVVATSLQFDVCGGLRCDTFFFSFVKSVVRFLAAVVDPLDLLSRERPFSHTSVGILCSFTFFAKRSRVSCSIAFFTGVSVRIAQWRFRLLFLVGFLGAALGSGRTFSGENVCIAITVGDSATPAPDVSLPRSGVDKSLVGLHSAQNRVCKV